MHGERAAASRRQVRVAAIGFAIAATMAACTSPPGQPDLPGLEHSVVNTTDGAGRGSHTVDGCQLLGTDSVFTQRIDGLPAETYAPGADPIERANDMMEGVGKNRMGSGAVSGPGYDGLYGGSQLNTVANSTRSVLIGTPNTGATWTPILLPASNDDVRWENMYASGGEVLDRHLYVLGTSPCRLQEHIRYSPVGPVTAASVEWELPVRAASESMLFVGGNRVNLDVDGAKLPISPLVHRYDEVVSQTAPISHALRIVFPADVNADHHVWPAGKSDGIGTSPAALPMGTRLRLKDSALSEHSLVASPEALKVLTALNHYGAVIADSSGATDRPEGSGGFGIGGDYDPRWPVGMTSAFPTVEVEDFEVVDISCWERSDSNRLAVRNGTLPTSC